MFTLNDLKAVALAAPEKDIRHYMIGVHVDRRGYLVATDGHRAHIIKLEEGATDNLPGSVTLPLNILKVLTALRVKGKDTITITAKRNQPDSYYELGNSTPAADYGRRVRDYDWYINGQQFTPVDGVYPVWDKVITNTDEPHHKSVDSDIPYSAEYLYDVSRAVRMLTGSKIGSNCPIQRIDGRQYMFTGENVQDRFAAIIMPTRRDHRHTINWLP